MTFVNTISTTTVNIILYRVTIALFNKTKFTVDYPNLLWIDLHNASMKSNEKGNRNTYT